MKLLVKTKWKIIFVASACILTLVLILNFAMSMTEMVSGSMEPTIFGRGNPPTHQGDLVVFLKWFNTNSLSNDDLVVAQIPISKSKIRTVLRIKQQPQTQLGKFYLHSDNGGIDSRIFGELTIDDIVGKVIWIIHRNAQLKPFDEL